MYIDLNFGNTFNMADTELDSDGHEICKLDKSDCSLMISNVFLHSYINKITKTEFGIFFTIASFAISRNNVLKRNGVLLNAKNIAIILEEEPSNIRRIIKKFDDIDLIKRIELNGSKSIIINPFVIFKGKTISNSTYALFKNTEWAMYEDCSIYLPKNNTRNSTNYNEFVENVLKRDNSTCQCCGSTLNQEVHHILPYAKYKSLRTTVSNGITLCECCHSAMVLGSFHQTYGTRNNTKEQLQYYMDNKRKSLGLKTVCIDDIVNQ